MTRYIGVYAALTAHVTSFSFHDINRGHTTVYVTTTLSFHDGGEIADLRSILDI